MSGKIRLGCANCDRDDFDGVDELPSDWTNIDEVQTFAESTREVDWSDQSRSALDWQTHVGVCPNAKRQVDKAADHCHSVPTETRRLF